MTRAIRRLSVVGALALLGWVGLLLTNPSSGADRPLRGHLAPLDTARIAGWAELARLSADDLETGRIRALDLVGDSLLVLQANAWSLVVAGRLVGTYGSAITGAPEYLARAEGIVLGTDGVTVLDAARHRLSFWSPEGTRLREVLLSDPSSDVQLYQSLGPAPAGGVYVTSWTGTDSGGHWLVTRRRGERSDTLLRGRALSVGESFNAPHVMVLADSSTAVVDASSWRIRRFDQRLELRDSAFRTDAPAFAIPTAIARRMRERIAMMPETQRRDFLIGETLPSVRAATITRDGALLVLTVHDEESTVAELIGMDGTPLATLWAKPDSNSVFAVRGQLLRVREELHVTIIERLRVRGHD